MKIIALDISTTSTGISIYENEELQNCFAICPVGKLMRDRFEPMARSLMNVIEREQPDVIGIEDTFMGVDADTNKFLTRLQGGVVGWSLLNNKRYYLFASSTWRSNLGFKLYENGKRIKREDLKNQSIDYVKEKFGIECNDDEADSVCIGLFTIGLEKGTFILSATKRKRKKKAIKKIA